MEAGRPHERWWERLGAAAAVVLLLAAGLSGVLRLSPGDGASAEPGGLSQARLLEHVGRLAAEPRPLGTAAHDRARDYIVEQLRALGLQPEVQRATAVIGRAPLVYVAEVENVVVRIEGGTPGAPAVLVASHYDSATTSPGAADDGAGVAIMLELARVLRGAPARGNAVILLFSDGEERGLLGARSFVQSHPWAVQVAAAINLEARGSGGRPVLLELGGAAPRLLELLGDSGASLMLGSYVTDGYRRSGNDTDFTVFREAGWPGYNLAFFGDPASYHTARDTVDRLDPATLAAHASAAARLTRALIAAPLASLAGEEEAVYAAGPGGRVISMARAWALPLAFLALALCAALAVLVRDKLRLRGVAVALAALLVSVVAAVVGVTFVSELVAWAVGPSQVRWEEADGFLLGALLLAGAIAVAGATLAARWCQRHELALGFAALLSVLAVAIALGAPSATLLAGIPALGAAAAAAVDLRWRRGSTAVRALLAVPAAVLWAEAAALLAIGLGLRAQGSLALLGALAALLLSTVVAGGRAALRWRAAAALLGASVVAFVVAGARAATDADHPAFDHLVLAVDLDARSARWATFDPAVDEWTGRVISVAEPADLRSFFGGRATPVLTSAAPLESWEASRVERAGADHPERALELRLWPAPGVTTVRLDFFSTAEIRAASVAGQALVVPPPPGDPALARLSLLYLHPPATGAAISLTLSAPAEVTVVSVDIRQGALAKRMPPRPATLVPGARWPTDCALIRRSVRFAASSEGGPT